MGGSGARHSCIGLAGKYAVASYRKPVIVGDSPAGVLVATGSVRIAFRTLMTAMGAGDGELSGDGGALSRGGLDLWLAAGRGWPGRPCCAGQSPSG